MFLFYLGFGEDFFSFPLCFLYSDIWGPYFPLLSLESKVQRKPGGGGKAAEAGAGACCAPSPGGSGERPGALLSSGQRMQAAGACLPAALRQAWDPSPHLSNTGQVAQTSSGLTGHPVLPARASSGPSDLLDLGSLPGHREARAFALPGQDKGAGSPTRVQRGPPTSEPKWSPDARPEDAARRPFLPGLQQSRNPAPRAINPQPQLLGNPSAGF